MSGQEGTEETDMNNQQETNANLEDDEGNEVLVMVGGMKAASIQHPNIRTGSVAFISEMEITLHSTPLSDDKARSAALRDKLIQSS